MSSAEQVRSGARSTEQASFEQAEAERSVPAQGRIGHHRIVARIGGGSTGTVYRCIDERTGEAHALKLAHGSAHGQNAALRREFALLFQLRARRQAGVVAALEGGRIDGRDWYAMEFVEGIDLATWVRQLWHVAPRDGLAFDTGMADDEACRQAAPPSSSGAPRLPRADLVLDRVGLEAGAGQLPAVLDLGSRLARILAGLHAAGVVHSDVSPRNVLVGPGGQPTLVDFSSAFYTGTIETAREIAQPELGLRGTPGYMAPEQIRGLPVDGRADLYGLGCVLYELVTGRPPFSGNSTAALCAQHLRATPVPPSDRVSAVPAELERLILSLLEKERHSRFPYALDVARALDELSGRSHTENDEPETPLYRARVVGRQAVVEALESQVRDVAGGTGAVVVLAGEVGAGKTRLLNDLATRAQLGGMEVIASRCLETRNSSGMRIARPALEPLTAVLERLADHAASESDSDPVQRLASELGVLSVYEPSLAEFVPASHDQPILPPELARGRVVRALAKALAVLSEPRPLLLVLDDLHWANDLTLEFLHKAIAGEVHIGRTLIAGTCRPDTLDVRLLAAVQAGQGVRLEVGRLSLEDIRAIARDMLASDLLPEGLGEFVFRLSGGNALFAAEYLKILAARKDLSRVGPRHWTFTEPAASAVALPTSLQELLDLELEKLSAEARLFLQHASVHSSGFSLDLVGAAEPGPGGEFSATVLVHELGIHQLLEERAPEQYRFVHEELRDALERSLPPDLRRALHRKAAERLARQLTARTGLADGSSAEEAQLANHYARAAEHAQALAHFERAARHAVDVHAYSLAGELYRAAVTQGELVFERGSSEAQRLLVPLREALADMLLRSARHEEARRNYAQIAADESCQPLGRARALRKKGKSFWLVHDYERALAALDAAALELGPLESLGPDEEQQEWIEVQQGRFWVHYFGRQIGEESGDLVRRMGPVVDRAGTSAQKAMFYQCAAGELLARRHYLYSSDAVQHARRAVEFSDPARYPAEAADARFALAFSLLHGDRAACEESVEQFSQAVRSLEDIGDATVLARLLTYQAVAHRRLRQIDAVQRVSARALAAAEAARLPAYMAAATACQAWVAWTQGDGGSAERLARQADLVWQNDRHVFPFRRLAGFVLLATRHAAEDFAGAAGILSALLAPQQQQFPDELARALADAKLSASLTDARRANEALARVLSLIHELGFD